MRIVVDMQGAQSESRFRGIGRYTNSFVRALLESRGDHEFILALNGLFQETIEPIRASFDGLLSQRDIRVWHAPGPVKESSHGNEGRRRVAELIREGFIQSLAPDLVHVTSLFEGYADDAVTSIGLFDQRTPVSVTLYDLIPLLNEGTYLKTNALYERNYREKLEHLGRATLLLAISESSRREAMAQLQWPDDRVVNVSTAADPMFRPTAVPNAQARALRRRVGLTRPFVLYTGGADERKNLPNLITAYARLTPELRETHQLLLAGKLPDGNVSLLKGLARAAGLRKDEFLVAGYVDDEDLLALYSLCRVFVFPSWHEGFGLPALEAMASGAAVIGSNTSSMPEVLGRADAMFDPMDAAAISTKLAEVLQSDGFRAELSAHGVEQSSRFSWDGCARRALEAFDRIHSVRNADTKPVARDSVRPRLIEAVAAGLSASATPHEVASIARAISHIPRSSHPRQLLLDVSELAQRDSRTGVQRVTRSILNELLEHPPADFVVEPVYATRDSTGYRYATAFMARFRSAPARRDGDSPIEYHPGDVFLGLDLQHHVVCAQHEFLQGLRRDGIRVVFVVYDMLPILMPDCFPDGAAAGHEIWLKAVSEFDGVVCISRAVADELKTWLAENPTHRKRAFDISWFRLGADLKNSMPTSGLPEDADMVLERLAQRPTFLSVGTVEPRKGYAQTLAAFDLLWSRNIDANLVIVGKQGWLVDDFASRLRAHPKFGQGLHWLEGISDEYLEKVYARSTCLLAASEGEGFGLPLIEAAQHGLPLIARDIPVFREVAGDNAAYFNGKSAEVLAQAISDWLIDYAANTHVESKDLAWLTWKESADELVARFT